MKKILITLGVSCCFMAYAQTLHFNDLKFKAIILNSSPGNVIAKDFNGNYITIDADGDGEIQLSEAELVKVLTIKLNEPSTYNDLPDRITDALLFTNIEELYINDSKSSVISFNNNDKIRKVLYTGSGLFEDNSGTLQSVPIDHSFDHCSSVQNINDFASDLNLGPNPSPILRFKNCSQINGNISINTKAIEELYIENCNVTSIHLNSCYKLKKLSVPDLSSLVKITLDGAIGSTTPQMDNQYIEITASNCTNLQEITTDSDHYNETGLYIKNLNVNGCTHLKKIKGINDLTVDFSTAGLANLEELDVSFYNRYVYYTTSGVYMGCLASLNLTGLPKLKILKASNQPITHNVNFSAAVSLENIDITNSCGYMNTVDVSNLASLHTLKSNRSDTMGESGNADLQKIIAKNCSSLTDLLIGRNYDLKELNIENCANIETLRIDNNYYGSGNTFNTLNSLTVKQCLGLKELTVENTKITLLDVSECPALQSLELANNTLLQNINLTDSHLQNISLNMLPLLEQVTLSNNNDLKNFQANACPLISQLDFSDCTNLEFLTLENMSNLTYVNIKNSSLEESNLYNYNSNLSICADTDQLATLQNQYSDIIFTSNCYSLLAKNNSKSDLHKINIFPNPVKDIVHIKSSDIIKNIKLFDTKGTVLLSKDYNESLIKIDLSSYLQGIYILNIQTDKEEQSKRIVKK